MVPENKFMPCLLNVFLVKKHFFYHYFPSFKVTNFKDLLLKTRCFYLNLGETLWHLFNSVNFYVVKKLYFEPFLKSLQAVTFVLIAR